MADYLTARAAIATIIDAVAITVPVATSIVKVYESRPDAGEGLNEFPCVLITGASSRRLRGPSSRRERQYRIGLRLVVRPVDGGGTMQAVLDALKEAIADAFDAKIMLGIAGGGYHVIEGPNWPEKEPFADGGLIWEDGELVLQILDTATLAA